MTTEQTGSKKTRKIIVTGGAGFVGSHLVDELCKDPNNEVTVIDNYSSYGLAHSSSYANPAAKYKCCDIVYEMSETRDVAELFSGVDVIYHLAAAARIQASFDEPTASLNTNVLGTMELLKLAYEKNKDSGKLPRIVFTSTSSLHKDCEGRGVNRGEIERLAHYKYGINPKTPYAIGKAAAEDLIVQYWGKQCGGEYVITRLFNVYGPRQPLTGKYATVVGLFEKQLLEGKHCTIVGDGLQQRDFTHVSDVVQVLAGFGAQVLRTSYMDYAYNLASGVSVDMISLVRLLAKHHGLTSYGFTHVPERKGESRNVLAKGYSTAIRSIHEVLAAKQTV